MLDSVFYEQLTLVAICYDSAHWYVIYQSVADVMSAATADG